MQRIVSYGIGDIVDDVQIVGFEYNEHHQKVALCKCIKCGRDRKLIEYRLRNHKGTSHKACGQFLKTKDPKFYRAWHGMKDRINNKNYWKYDRYGGRGLTTDYENFIDFYDDYYNEYVDALNKLGNNIQIDRINNDLGYVKGNIRFTTQEHQVRNSQKVRCFFAVQPDNKLYYSNNQMQFASNHGLQAKQVGAVLTGRFQQTLGWKFYYEEQLQIDKSTCIQELYY